MRISIIIFLALIFSACSASSVVQINVSADGMIDYNKKVDAVPVFNEIGKKVGIVETDEGRFICFRTNNKDLKPGTPVLIVDLLSDYYGRSQRTFEAYIEKETNPTCAPRGMGSGDRYPELSTYYSLAPKREDDRPKIDLGIAVVDPAARPHVVRGQTGLDLDNDGKDEYFRVCTSTEGLHLTIWKDRPLTGTRIWHNYYYLKYETEPTCDERDWLGT